MITALLFPPENGFQRSKCHQQELTCHMAKRERKGETHQQDLTCHMAKRERRGREPNQDARNSKNET